MEKTICIDFDGVIHLYRHGFRDGSIYDIPVEGAFNAIKRLLPHYNIVVMSTREPKTILDWFLKQPTWKYPVKIIPNDGKFEWTEKGVVGITNRKLKAMVYIDDRGLRFTNWKDILNYVR